MLVINHNIRIPLREFHFSFARSSGPGGQNVNKVNSKAILRWAIFDSPSIPPAVRHRFLEKFYTKVSAEGNVVVSSDRFRDQSRNKSDCLEKLRSLLLQVAKPPIRRRATKPSRRAKQKRIDRKRKQSKKKQMRRRPGWDD